MGTLPIKILVIVGILFGFKEANAVKCYKCDSSDSKCKDPFEASGVGTTVCEGTCYKIKEVPNEQAARRGCQTKYGLATKGCAEGTLDVYSGLLCSCQENLCNYALPVGSSIMVTAAAMIINIVLR